MTAITFPLSPPGAFTWRAATASDVPALEHLQLAANAGWLDPCERTDFSILFARDRSSHVVTLCAADIDGHVVAYASAEAYSLPGEHRADLDSVVLPVLRSGALERFLLSWVEGQARQFLAELPADRPKILRIAFTDRRADALPLYTRHGFRFTFAADTLRRRLTEPIPARGVPDGLMLVPWSEHYADACYQVYLDAFGARPDYACWSKDVWKMGLIDLPSFRPHCSRVLLHGETPIGYVLGGLEQGPDGKDIGHFIQLGVRTAWRGRGAGSGLMLSALRAYQMHDLSEALLEVDADNPGARRLHDRLGFTQAARLTIYSKPA